MGRTFVIGRIGKDWGIPASEEAPRRFTRRFGYICSLWKRKYARCHVPLQDWAQIVAGPRVNAKQEALLCSSCAETIWFAGIHNDVANEWQM